MFAVVALEVIGTETSETNEVAMYVQVTKRCLRNNVAIMDISNNDNFRMNKRTFSSILKEISNHFVPAYRCTNISKEIKLATFLRFLATGSYQKGLGNEYLSSVSQAMVSEIIDECLNIFETKICEKWIRLQMSPEEEIETKMDFNEKCGFPGVVGCIDGSHIKIMAPKQELRHLYYCRKGYYSINAMVICDNNQIIRYVDARHPGSNHDSFIWQSSPARDLFQIQHNNGKQNTWLLGDGGYSCQPYMMTPYRVPTTESQERFNRKQRKARNIIERCFGVLKTRWRVLNMERGIHYSPEKATKIINASCALHNICIYFKNNWPAVNEEEDFVDFANSICSDASEGLRLRDFVANNLT